MSKQRIKTTLQQIEGQISSLEKKMLNPQFPLLLEGVMILWVAVAVLNVSFFTRFCATFHGHEESETTVTYSPCFCLLLLHDDERLFIFLAFAVSRENGDSSIFSGGRIYFSGNLLVDFMMKFVFTLLLTLDRKFQGCRKSIRNWCEKRNETGITQRNTKHTFKSQNADVDLLAKRSNNQTCAVLFLISIIKKKKEKFSFLAHSWPPYLE